MSAERFTDDLAPTLVGAAATWSAIATGPVRRAPLSDEAGRLGWVWTDDQRAAGWLPDAATREAARAGAYAWRVLANAHQRGEPASRLLDPALYAPLYQLGDPVPVD